MSIFNIFKKIEKEVIELPPRGVHPPIPDWRSFKVEECPELVKVQKELAAYGLKDPWLRNEAWRFNPKQFPGTVGQRLIHMYFRGFKWGLVLAVTHASIKYMVSGDDGHGHGDEHDDHGH
ncbi:UNVERIFIED_CONTAM: hypothetical protein RMT77_006473 [Armadillidium vulgare]|nr:NADH dehydrogenase [ubiquinone] 1 beta subcomplex subunit 3 [Armadillidium vulgare]